jgi:hypothetical protein
VDVVPVQRAVEGVRVAPVQLVRTLIVGMAVGALRYVVLLNHLVSLDVLDADGVVETYLVFWSWLGRRFEKVLRSGSDGVARMKRAILPSIWRPWLREDFGGLMAVAMGIVDAKSMAWGCSPNSPQTSDLAGMGTSRGVA